MGVWGVNVVLYEFVGVGVFMSVCGCVYECVWVCLWVCVGVFMSVCVSL